MCDFCIEEAKISNQTGQTMKFTVGVVELAANQAVQTLN